MPSLHQFGDDRVDTATTLREIATENETRAKKFKDEHWDLDVRNLYFRFNLRDGLEGTELEVASSRDPVILATKRYLDSKTVVKQMKLCGIPPSRSKLVSSSKSAAMKVSANGFRSDVKLILHIYMSPELIQPT